MSLTGEEKSLVLLPLGLAPRERHLSTALPLAGSGLAFSACEVTIREAGAQTIRTVLPTDGLLAWAEAQRPDDLPLIKQRLIDLTRQRADFAGLALSKPRVMGIINVTPDSFSDGGDRYDDGRAVQDGLAMREAGADILDVGGESTRPGAEPVPIEEELRRVIPVVRRLAEQGAVVSIDTRRARVMREAAGAGAAIINDVTALTGEPDSLSAAAESGLPLVLMHMLGEPQTMQNDPIYADVTAEVFDYLCNRIRACEEAGIPRQRIAVDPGIGFGKTIAHNLILLDRLAAFHGTGCAVLLGASRKRFIGTLSRGENPKQRVAGSLACALGAAERAVQLIRVHDVAETCQALALHRAIASATAV